MEIQFNILNALSKSPSKKYVRKLIEYVIMTRFTYESFDQYSVTPVTKSLSQDLQLEESETELLLINLGRLIGQAGRSQFKNLDKLFPEDFNKQLQQMLINMIELLQESITGMDNSRLTQADKLIGFDWRLDMQMANQAGKKSESMALLELQTVGEKGFKTTGFQMGIEQIGALHQNLKKIKDQLNSLIG